MNAHFVTSGYCGLLDSAIAKQYPIAVRNREITYEAATPSSVPQVFSVPEIMLSSFLSEDGGIAEMALMHLVMSGSITDRGDGFQVIPVGVSLFLEMKHQEEEIANLMTQTELVDALQKNGRKPIRYSLSVASQRQGFMSGFPPQTLLIESYASPLSNKHIAHVGPEGDVLSAFFRIMRRSNQIESLLCTYIRSLMSVPELN